MSAKMKRKLSIGRKKLTFIGASYLFVHRVLRDMILAGGFNDIELCLLDIRKEPLKLVGDLLEKIARQKETNIRITRTLNRREALKGASAVALSITVGGREPEYRTCEACLKYGIKTEHGDTMGPAALSRNLRMVPVVLEIMRDMERYCPKAIMLNFTNPMSVITGAIARSSNIPVFGLCHSGDALFNYFASIFRCSKKDVKLEIGGINHQAFATKVMIRGKDRTKDLNKISSISRAGVKDELMEREEEVTLQREVFNILGAWPSTGSTHIAEFYKYFFTSQGIRKHGFASKTKRLLPRPRKRLKWNEPHPLVKKWACGPGPVEDLDKPTDEHAHELIWSYFTGKPCRRIVNILNTQGAIRNAPRTACVEVLATIAGKKVTAKPITLPLAIESLIHTWTTIHDLSIQAAVNCDRGAALQALFLDPHVREFEDIELLLDDIIKATRKWLPKKWSARKK